MKNILLPLLFLLSLRLSAQVMRVEMKDGTNVAFDTNKIAVVDFLEGTTAEEDSRQKEAVTGAVADAGVSYAEIIGYANTGLATIANSGSIEMGVEVATSPDFLNEGIRYTTNSLTGNRFNVVVTGLVPNSDYYYRAYVKAHEIYYNGEIKSFRTKDFEDIVTSCNFSTLNYLSNPAWALVSLDIAYDNAYFNAREHLSGDISVGFNYGKSPDDLHLSAKALISDEKQSVNLSVNVEEGTTIYYRTATWINDACRTSDKVYSMIIPCRYVGAEGDGSKDNPYNVAGINKLTSHLPLDAKSEPVYFKGIVTEITESPGNMYGNATFYISDNGENDNTFYCYRVMAPGNIKWTSEDQLKVGDEVVLYGQVINHAGILLETLAQSCYVVSINGVEHTGEPDRPLNNDCKGNGTAGNPYNVAGIVNYVSSLSADVQSDYEVYFSGIVKNFKAGEEPGNSYGNATFYITDEDGRYTFYCFRVFGKNGVRFTEGAEWPSIGDRVTIRGLVVNYKGNTPESVSGKAFIESIDRQDSRRR